MYNEDKWAMWDQPYSRLKNTVSCYSACTTENISVVDY